MRLFKMYIILFYQDQYINPSFSTGSALLLGPFAAPGRRRPGRFHCWSRSLEPGERNSVAVAAGGGWSEEMLVGFCSCGGERLQGGCSGLAREGFVELGADFRREGSVATFALSRC
ncbi:unnamed protein product [Cuscuta europaea]|uniref:Uncharacterized protein n=1 Tax=Cuscuta europaea TaxID=41803 RepID=A0A9P1E8T3_CUSEU|nr:unnamed protein product [Cuscuta europaea]